MSATQALLPYDQTLEYFVPYFQQADMESNGKRVDRDGVPVDYATGPILWGGIGTNGQHAYFQLIHQGTQMIPADFIASAQSFHPLGEHHATLLSNFFAQTEALMRGKTEAEARGEIAELPAWMQKPLRRCCRTRCSQGNKPTNSILFEKLTPRTLGRLIACTSTRYSCRASSGTSIPSTSGAWNWANSWLRHIQAELRSGAEITAHDSSTNGLIHHYNALK